jgi:PTH1 family peptidyl-tRNA hydrolase
MKLIVGLGNPGREYAKTRHNVGFEAIDVLAERLAWTPVGDFDRLARQRFQALTFEGAIDTATGAEKVMLMKPITFMNLSGRAVKEAMSFYKLTPADVLVMVDDLALPVGKLRLRGEGSAGGQNGLKDIQRALGTPQYARLRIGIDAPPPPVAGKDYVLGKFSEDQRIEVDKALPKAAACAVVWADAGLERAMNEFNG